MSDNLIIPQLDKFVNTLDRMNVLWYTMVNQNRTNSYYRTFVLLTNLELYVIISLNLTTSL